MNAVERFAPADFEPARHRTAGRMRSRAHRCRTGRTRGAASKQLARIGLARHRHRPCRVCHRRTLGVARRSGCAGYRSDQPGTMPFPPPRCIVEPSAPWAGVTTEPSAIGHVPSRICAWRNQPRRRRCGSSGNPCSARLATSIYRSIYDPAPDRALGLPLGDVLGAQPRQLRRPAGPRPDSVLVLGCRSRCETAPNMTSTRRSPSMSFERSPPRKRWLAGGRQTRPRSSVGDQITLPFHPLGHRLSGPRHAGAARVRRAGVALHWRGGAAPVRADRDRLRQHRRIRGGTRRPVADALRGVRHRPAVSAVHDPLQDCLRHRAWRERRLSDARRAGDPRLASHRPARAGTDPADPPGGLRLRVAAPGRQDRLPACSGT